ncbi:MAG: TetR family transcriptional regulator [Austwickia sp.]|nr:MAG: TetR family transcriptional regulator [Austwickia sp.]
MASAKASSPRSSGDTRNRLLEAAVDVLAELGMGSFTHRIVEQRAGVYHGATTHFFGSRDQLVDAVFGHLFALDQDAVRRQPEVAPAPETVSDPGVLRASLRAGARALLDGRREALARYALVVHAAQEPRLQASLAHWRGAIVMATAPVMALLGARDAEGAARVFIAGVDGLLLHRLSAPWGVTDAQLDAMVDALLAGSLGL